MTSYAGFLHQPLIGEVTANKYSIGINSMRTEHEIYEVIVEKSDLFN
jgi:hypothetical protein